MKETTVQLSLDELTAIHALVYAQISSNERSIRLSELAKLDTSEYINSNDVLAVINKKLESASINLLNPQI